MTYTSRDQWGRLNTAYTKLNISINNETLHYVMMMMMMMTTSLNLMYNIFSNVAPSYMCDINRISHRHYTRQSDSAYVVPGVKGRAPNHLNLMVVSFGMNCQRM